MTTTLSPVSVGSARSHPLRTCRRHSSPVGVAPPVLLIGVDVVRRRRRWRFAALLNSCWFRPFLVERQLLLLAM